MGNQWSAMGLSTSDRFWPKVSKSDGCWQWRGAVSSGYGMLWVERRMVPAHRVAYELIVGPIPDGMVIDHLCRNHGCVNPDHLEPVTNHENILRGISATARNARKPLCSLGHPFDRVAKDGRRLCMTCQRRRAKGVRERKKARRQTWMTM